MRVLVDTCDPIQRYILSTLNKIEILPYLTEDSKDTELLNILEIQVYISLSFLHFYLRINLDDKMYLLLYLVKEET